MMKQTTINTLGYWFLMMAASLCSCSSDDDVTPQEDSNGRSMRQLTISNVSMNTRATINPSTYKAVWATTDRPTYINLSMLPAAELRYGTLTPTGTGASTALTGSVYCTQGDQMAIVLPTVTPVLSAGGSASFTIDLSGQKGTLNDIGTRYHYIYGVGSVTSTDGNTATGTITNTKSLLSLCKFTFTHNNSLVNVKSVQIGWGQTGAAGYPQTGTVSHPNPDNEPYPDSDDYLDAIFVTAGAPIAGTPLTITLDNANAEGVVYVALFPCEDKLTFHFTVSDGTGTYTATKSAKMLEGRYYEVTVAVE